MIDTFGVAMAGELSLQAGLDRSLCEGTQTRGDQGHPTPRHASHRKSEVIRAILFEGSPYCAGCTPAPGSPKTGRPR